MNARKLKGEEKMPQMNEKRQIYSKIRVWENYGGAKSERARKLEAQNLKEREF